MIKIIIVYKKEMGSLNRMMSLLHQTIMVDHKFNISEDYCENNNKKFYYVSFELEISKFNRMNFRKNLVCMLKKLNDLDVLVKIPNDCDLHLFGFSKDSAPTPFKIEDTSYPIIYDNKSEYPGDKTAATISALNISKAEVESGIAVYVPEETIDVNVLSINSDVLPKDNMPLISRNENDPLIPHLENRRLCHFFSSNIDTNDLIRRMFGIGAIGLTLGFVVPVTALIAERKPQEILQGYCRGFRF